MTIDEQIKRKNTKEFAAFLLSFYVGFNCECIDELCDSKPCNQCKDGCVGCIEEWLHSNRNLNINK